MTPLSLPVWYFGYAFWLVVLLVIVACVAAILHLARTLGDQSREIAIVLNACRRHTDTMPNVQDINDATRGVTRTLSEVRAAVGTVPIGGPR